MSLAVLVTERLSPGVRGALALWFMEVNPGIYVGTLSQRIRARVWEEVCAWVETNDLGYALLIEPDDSEQGYRVSTVGTSDYEMVDHDGLWLVSRHSKAGHDSGSEPETVQDECEL